MSDADRIAVNVQHTIAELKRLGATPNCVVLGLRERMAIENNSDACAVPDYDHEADTFCGLPLVPMSAPPPSFLAVGIKGLWEK